MTNPICKKIEGMLCLYIENKLNDEDRFFIEKHFKTCSSCFQKYIEMKKILKNLHFEYAKLMQELQKAENEKIFSIREHENFFQNISPYIDNELCYEDSIKFRKYLLKSKYARNELASAYDLKNNIKNSINDFKNKININYSNKILKQLEEKNFDKFEKIYKKVAIFIAFLLSTLILISIYLGFSYINDTFAKNKDNTIVKSIEIPNENKMIEFTFDNNKNPIIISK